MKIKILNLHQIVIKRIVKNDGYLLISKNISLYHVIHQMPIKLDPNKLDQRINIEKKMRSINKTVECNEQLVTQMICFKYIR